MYKKFGREITPQKARIQPNIFFMLIYLCLISAALRFCIFNKFLSNKSCSRFCHVGFSTYLSAAKQV